MNHLKKLSKKDKMKYITRIALYPPMLLISQFGKVFQLFGTKKKHISVSILCAAMIMTMLPAMSLTAFAKTATPLTFTAEADNSSVTLHYVSGTNVMYQSGDEDWVTYAMGDTISLNRNDTVRFKGTDIVTNYDNHFSMAGKLAASGDVTSLTNGIGGDVTLTDNCYEDLFYGCTSLTKAPELPATTLADFCYYEMFRNCTGLTKAPELPATTLTDYCYFGMFGGCTSLTDAPTLPATTLADFCYYGMFRSCAGLTDAPELPATTLAAYCYSSMFYRCTSLKISETKTGAYTKEWYIPSTVTATTAEGWNSEMLSGTGGTFTGDLAENTTYYLYEDDTSPVISGMEDGKTYCITAAFTVTDEDLDTVMANENTLTATSGKYVLTAVGANTVVATDKTGNSTTITVTINANHTWETEWSSDGTNHWHECCNCGEKKDIAAHIRDDGVVTTEPTATEKGVKTYTCTICGETKTEEIDKLTPSIIDGENGIYQQGSKGGLTFKSNASFADFESVSVDGKAIDKTSYTLQGSGTVITLTAEYLSILSVGRHTLAIHSASGTASTEFTIVAKATAPVSPQTGDTSNMVLWLALLLVSGGALTTLGLIKKRKIEDNK